MKTVEARYYKVQDGQVTCQLCPHYCRLDDGEFGLCGVRRSVAGKLETYTYGRVSSIAVDPIEKKPLHTFMPGTDILSFGSVGCNFDCGFCQNCDISKTFDLDGRYKEMTPGEIVGWALEHDVPGIAYTYNEPTVFYEMMLETAKLAKTEGLWNVIVTNGYINREPFLELAPYIDAMNIDVKTYEDQLYKEVCNGHLRPVIETVKRAVDAGIHVELTSLMVPGLFDDLPAVDDFFAGLREEVGDLYIHLSRYFPRFRYDSAATDIAAMLEMQQIVRRHFSQVTLGNVGFM